MVNLNKAKEIVQRILDLLKIFVDFFATLWIVSQLETAHSWAVSKGTKENRM